MSQVDSSGGRTLCWPWTGYINPQTGYGQFAPRINGDLVKRSGRLITAARAAYELFIGPMPEGMETRHRCDNRPCSNPAHLLAGTRKQNVADMFERGRASPKRGFLAAENPGSKGGKIGGAIRSALSPAERSAIAHKGAATRRRNRDLPR